MVKCPYCESDLILINTYNCKDIYCEEGYETHWHCKNEGCRAWILGRIDEKEVE